jgi:hypothetical protein
MTLTSLRVHIAHQCPGRDQLRTTRFLTHLRDMASNLHNVPPKEPIMRDAGQDSTENTGTQTPPTGSRPIKNRTRSSRASTQMVDSGASSSNRGNPSIQSTQPSNRSHNPKSTVSRRLNSGAGHNSIHSTVTSTRPSYLNSQWRAHSTQPSNQQTTSTTDTEGLTQALQQLTTEDNPQDTATTTKPTKSRWRTAKPINNQQTSSKQQTSTNPATINTKTPSTTSNPKAKPSNPKSQSDLRRSQRQKGTATGLHNFEASWTHH